MLAKVLFSLVDNGAEAITQVTKHATLAQRTMEIVDTLSSHRLGLWQF